MRLTIDIETIPTQDPDIRRELAKPFLDKVAEKRQDTDRAIAELRAPSNYKDPEKIASWEINEKPRKAAALAAELEQFVELSTTLIDQSWRKTSLDGAFGKCVVIGAAIDNADPKTFYVKDWSSPTAEPMVLRSFYDWLVNSTREVDRMNLLTVGHWVWEFDLRFLFQRSVIHGIAPPFFLPMPPRNPRDNIFCTMTTWAGYGNRISLDKLCRVCGVPGKGSEIGDEIDGSKVWDFVRDGRIDEVATYCAGDVMRAREVYKRMTFAEAA
jgi:hypothetical protein